MKGHFVEPQEIAPQRANGVDHSAKGLILVRAPGAMLVWRKSGKVWSGIGMAPSYTPVSLQVVGTKDAESYADITGEDIFEGGRLTMNRIGPEIGKIRKLMGLPDLSILHIHFKKTYVVEER